MFLFLLVLGILRDVLCISLLLSVNIRTLIAANFLKYSSFICGQKFNVIRCCSCVISVKNEKVTISEIGIEVKSGIYVHFYCM